MLKKYIFKVPIWETFHKSAFCLKNSWIAFASFVVSVKDPIKFEKWSTLSGNYFEEILQGKEWWFLKIWMKKIVESQQMTKNQLSESKRRMT